MLTHRCQEYYITFQWFCLVSYKVQHLVPILEFIYIEHLLIFYTQGDELQRHKGPMTEWSVNADTEEHIQLYLHRTRGKKKKKDTARLRRLLECFKV